MKTLITLALLCLLFTGCAPKNYAIGISESEFLKHNHAAVLVQSSNGVNVYEKVDYGFGHPASTRFYYFRNGTLFQVDMGVRNPDVVIQNQY